MPRGRRALVEPERPVPQAAPIGQAAAAVAEEAAPEPNGDAEAFRLPACITERQLRALLRADEEVKGQVDQLTAQQREAIADSVERNHLHKGAYSWIKKLRKCKTAEQKALLFYSFLEYVKLSGELRIIEAVPALPLEGEPVPSQRPSAEVVELPRNAAAH